MEKADDDHDSGYDIDINYPALELILSSMN